MCPLCDFVIYFVLSGCLCDFLCDFVVLHFCDFLDLFFVLCLDAPCKVELLSLWLNSYIHELTLCYSVHVQKTNFVCRVMRNS